MKMKLHEVKGGAGLAHAKCWWNGVLETGESWGNPNSIQQSYSNSGTAVLVKHDLLSEVSGRVISNSETNY